MESNRMEAKADCRRALSLLWRCQSALVKTLCCDQWICVIRRFFSFRGAGGAKWSTNASACATPTMRISIVALGKAVRSAVSSGRHEITKCMRKNPINWPKY